MSSSTHFIARDGEHRVNGELVLKTTAPSFTWQTSALEALPWLTASQPDEAGRIIFKLDKKRARLVTVSESEDELVLRLEAKG